MANGCFRSHSLGVDAASCSRKGAWSGDATQGAEAAIRPGLVTAQVMTLPSQQPLLVGSWLHEASYREPERGPKPNGGGAKSPNMFQSSL